MRHPRSPEVRPTRGVLETLVQAAVSGKPSLPSGVGGRWSFQRPSTPR